MITNLLATIVVTLVTNAPVVTDNAEYEMRAAPCPEHRIGCLVNHWERGPMTKPATEKTETITVDEVRKLTTQFEGVKIEKELSKKEVRRYAKTYKLNQEWKLISEGPVKPPELSGYVTNNIYVTLDGRGCIATNLIAK